jgi:hypothetical protein
MDSFPYTDYETELQMHFASVANAYDPNHLSYNQLASDIFLPGTVKIWSFWILVVTLLLTIRPNAVTLQLAVAAASDGDQLYVAKIYFSQIGLF